MPIEQARKPQNDQDDEIVNMDFLRRKMEIQRLIVERKKAEKKLIIFKRQLDCAVQNRARAFRRLESAEINMRDNVCNAHIDLKNANLELEFRNREMEAALAKEGGIYNYIDEITVRLEKLMGKTDPKELFDEVLIDLHKIFDEKQHATLKLQL